MIKAIKLKQFRNHHGLNLPITQRCVFLFGSNGLGKTSVLESIYFASLTKSFRTNEDRALIETNMPFAKIQIDTDKHHYEVVISETGTKVAIDKKQIFKMSEYIGGYRVIMFSPEDLELVKGQPAIRRQFLDIEMTQINKEHLLILSKYKQILKQRNALLKQIGIKDDLTFLDIIGDQLSLVADQLIENRMQFIEKLNDAFKKRFKAFNNKDEVYIEYEPNTPLKGLKTLLKEKKEKDILTQTTNYGPHRDEWIIYFNQKEAKTYASQGESRLIVIALKLALLDIYETKDTVILLDDVLSELDPERQTILLENLPKEYQMFLTGTEPVEIKEMETIQLKEYKNG